MGDYDYTPTMQQWRGSFRRFLTCHNVSDPDELIEELDAVLEKHDREVARATLEGYARMVLMHMDPDVAWDREDIAHDVRGWLEVRSLDVLLEEGK